MSKVDEGFDSESFLKTVTSLPGVYRMKNANADVIYVGKAGSLKKRLSSYFRKDVDSPKTRALVSHIADIEVTVTATEAEALILEHNLIKQFRPRYNVLLRDDKSYPYIFISTEDDYPRLSLHRGSRKRKGRYIGPYPNVGAVKKTLRYAQKLFNVRQCEDSYFANRSRPCLQYQINNCSAPCVELIDRDEYRKDVLLTEQLLMGRSEDIHRTLVEEMEAASAALAFEKAAMLRDRIQDLKVVNEQRFSSKDSDLDILCCLIQEGLCCIQVFFIRNGVNLGNRAFFPKIQPQTTQEEALYGFLGQFYLDRDVPKELVLNVELPEQGLLEEALSQRAGKKIHLVSRVRTERKHWLGLAEKNAQVAIATRLSSKASQHSRLLALQQLLGLDEAPEHIECFDISHTGGEKTVASCVVFNQEGPNKDQYRRFNITDITPGDDYAAMKQALERRFTRLLKEQKSLPDVLLIDGGKGQISMALQVLETLCISELAVVGVSKGPERRPGEEVLILCQRDGEEVRLGNESLALQLVQQVRDEAHRFAIEGHRQKRDKARKRSALEDIPMLGPKRRKALLTHFGGLQGVARASVIELAKVPGIHQSLAEQIYDFFHEN